MIAVLYQPWDNRPESPGYPATAQPLHPVVSAL